MFKNMKDQDDDTEFTALVNRSGPVSEEERLEYEKKGMKLVETPKYSEMERCCNVKSCRALEVKKCSRCKRVWWGIQLADSTGTALWNAKRKIGPITRRGASLKNDLERTHANFIS